MDVLQLLLQERNEGFKSRMHINSQKITAYKESSFTSRHAHHYPDVLSELLTLIKTSLKSIKLAKVYRSKRISNVNLRSPTNHL